MITKWGVENFKSIRKADLDLAPLTVFTGVNSSGKSSFLQSILMLVQDAKRSEEYDYDNDVSIDYNGIKLNGKLVKLGSFDRISHNNSNEIRINCNIPSEEFETARLELRLSKDFSFSKDLEIDKLILECKKNEDKDSCLLDNNDGYLFDEHHFLPDGIYLPSLSTKCYGEYDEETENDIEKFIKLLVEFPEKELDKIEAQKYAEEKIASGYLDKRIVKKLLTLCTREEHDPFDSTIVNRSPFAYAIPDYEELFKEYTYADIEERTNKYKYRFCDCECDYSEACGECNIELADWYEVLSKQDKQKQESIPSGLNAKLSQELIHTIKICYRALVDELPKRSKEARDYLHEYFRNKINYLDPLSFEPQDVYKNYGAYDMGKPIGCLSAMDFGKGEYTMSVINYLYEKNKKIKNYFSPGFFKDPDYKPEEEKYFSEAFEEWLKYFGIADKFKSRGLGGRSLSHTNLLSNQIAPVLVIDGEEYSLTQLGTGVSRILPILAMCLASPVDSTLIIQEPEQNLHPKWQSLLADFFIAMSLSGRQCLIETHSKYLIEKIRCYIVMLSSRNIEILNKKPLHERTKLYFVNKEDGVSHFKDIKANEFISLDKWPEGLFDESSNISKKMVEEVVKTLESYDQND